MTNLEEKAIWEDVVFMIQRNTPVGGGPNGPANKPHIALANRTQYLKEQVEKITDDLSRALSSLEDNPAFQANNERIENLQDPKNEQDAATKNYVDAGDGELQNQFNELKEAVSLGWELVGDFTTGCTVSFRNEIVYDDINNKYYCWVGELPHDIAAGTNPVEEITQGKHWLLIDNSNSLVSKVEEIRKMAENALTAIKNSALPQDLTGEAGKLLIVNDEENGYNFINSTTVFYGFRTEGAKLILEINEEKNIAARFSEWFIAPMGCRFSIEKNELLMNI